MAKRVDPLKAKAAKQKKMAIVLSVVFAALLAYQVPKTLKMLNGPAAAAGTAAEQVPISTTSPPGTATPGVPGAPAPAGTAPAPAGEAQPAVLVDSDLPVAAGEGQLLSFEQFQATDPFVQQVDSAAAGGVAPTSAPPAPSKPADEEPAETFLPGTGTATGTSSGSDSSSKPNPSTTSTAEPVAPAEATTITMNGSPAVLAADGSFPADKPIFVLVSAAKDGTSVQIGIAGGVYADGDKTITLKVGKTVTLQNTADGSRYELELLTVKGFAPPKSTR